MLALLSCMQLIPVSIITLISLLSLSANACWDGFKNDSLKSPASVFARGEDNAFQVAKLPKGKPVCTGKVVGNYTEIQFEKSSNPDVPVFGFVRTATLKSSKLTEAVATCADCDQPIRKKPVMEKIVLPEISEEDQEPVRQTNIGGVGEPLPYADRLQKNISYGRGVGKSMCGRAVARILRASDLLPGGAGPLSTPGGFNGEDAYGYLKARGFYDDKSACKRPGVVLVYAQAKSGFAGAGRKYLAGDVYGHVEILGTDGNYHYYTSSSASIDAILGANRRPLIHCMVSKVGMAGGKL